MKNRLLKDILVLLEMMVIIVIICRFLPEQICLQINIIFYWLQSFHTLHIGSLLGGRKVKRLNETPFIFTDCIKIKNNYFKR